MQGFLCAVAEHLVVHLGEQSAHVQNFTLLKLIFYSWPNNGAMLTQIDGGKYYDALVLNSFFGLLNRLESSISCCLDPFWVINLFSGTKFFTFLPYPCRLTPSGN